MDVSAGYSYSTPMTQFSTNQPLPRLLPSEPLCTEEFAATQRYQNEMELVLGSTVDGDMSTTRPLLHTPQDWRGRTVNGVQVSEDTFGIFESVARDNSQRDTIQIWGSEALYDASLDSQNHLNANEIEAPGYSFHHSFISNASSRASQSSVETWPVSSARGDPSSQSLLVWTDPNSQVSQVSDADEYKAVDSIDAESLFAPPRYVLPSQNADPQDVSHHISPSASSTMEYASPATDSTSPPAISPPANDGQQTRDEFLIRCRQNNISYKDIKERGGFEQSVSTLRGRYRNLTKGKQDRLRKPKWTPKDVREAPFCRL